MHIFSSILFSLLPVRAFQSPVLFTTQARLERRFRNEGPGPSAQKIRVVAIKDIVKEAKILNSGKGHRNINKYLGLCSELHAIMMMQCSSFNFVFSEVQKRFLADFLQYLDSELEFL